MIRNILFLIVIAAFSIKGLGQARINFTDSITDWKVHYIKLDTAQSFYDNQYSSICKNQNSIFLMSESRIEDKMPAFVDKTSSSELSKAIIDSSYSPIFQRLPLHNLELIRLQILQRHQNYEGLEAMAINQTGDSVYFSIETTTHSDSAYIIKGKLENDRIEMDINNFVGIQKPKDAKGKYIYNAGYESLEYHNNQLFAIFEYDHFLQNNLICISSSLNPKTLSKETIAAEPFRITDISWDSTKQLFWGINYFYRNDKEYQLQPTDSDFNQSFANGYHNFTRLVTIQKQDDQFKIEPYKTLPKSLWGYNMEGLQIFEKGFLLCNDYFTPYKKHSDLIYIEPIIN